MIKKMEKNKIKKIKKAIKTQHVMEEGTDQKRILVTGSKGGIGRHLVKFLELKGHKVKGVDKEQDLTIFQNALEATKDIDEIYHLAADVGGIGYLSDPKNSRKIIQNSVINFNVFEAASINSVKKIFFASSSCVYSKSGIQSETDVYPANPENIYGWEKLYGEIMSKSFPEIDFKIARFQNIYGPESHYDDGREMAVVALCRKIRDSQDGIIEIWGDGNQMRNWIYIDDCCEVMCKLMDSDIKEIINLGVDESISIKDLAELLIEISGKDIKIKYIDGPLGIIKKISDNILRKSLLEWTPKVSLKEGLKKTYEWVVSIKNDK